MGKLNQSIKGLVMRRKKLILERHECQNVLGRIKYEELSKRSRLYKVEALCNREDATINLREESIENMPSFLELDLKEIDTKITNLLYRHPVRGAPLYLYYSIVK